MYVSIGLSSAVWAQCTNVTDRQTDKPIDKLARTLLSFRRPTVPLRSSGNIPPSAEWLTSWWERRTTRCLGPALIISRRRFRLAYYALRTAKLEYVAIANLAKSANFGSECGRAKCFFPQSSKPNELVFTTRCTLVQSAVLRSHVVCLSVCPSVTLVNCDHIRWNSAKIISPLVSLGRSLFATPTWRVCSKGNIPKFGSKVTHPLLIWASETFDRKLRPKGYR